MEVWEVKTGNNMKEIKAKMGKVLSWSKIIVCMLIVALLMSFGTDSFVIDGDIDGPDGTIIKLTYEYNGKKVSDSTTIKNNKLLLKGSLPETVICTLTNSINQQMKLIVLQNEQIQVKGSVAKFYQAVVSGAVQDDLFTQFKAKVFTINSDYRNQLKASGADFHDKTSRAYLELHRRTDSLTLAFVKTYPDATAASIAIINSHKNSTNASKAEECYRLLSEKGRANYYARRVKSFIDTSKGIELGGIAPNFTLRDSKGRSVSLKDYRGKYVFLDFWASWCAPCREEHPMLKKLYSKYQDKEIVFMSVSVDTNEKSWRQALIEDGLLWTQLHDPLALKGPMAESYSLSALPFNLILDPQGKIIGTKLRGEALGIFLHDILKIE